MNEGVEYKFHDWAFKFLNKNDKWYVQIWLTNTAFSVVVQGHWDHYVDKFKFVGNSPINPKVRLADAIPKHIQHRINTIFKLDYKPEHKEIGR